MKTIYANDLQQLNELNPGIAATVGFFDGVHLGHRFLIEQLKEEAHKAGIPSAVITFPIHPRKILHTDYLPKLLTNFEEKIFQLSATGIDYCIVIDFTKELSGYSAQDFIRQMLFEQLHVKLLLAGYDHRFGKDRKEGFDEYKKYGEDIGLKVILANPLIRKKITPNSTVIREMLLQGDVKGAALLLSYNYQLKGLVVDGNKKGSEIGFPTANIDLFDKEKIIPKEGVYAVRVTAEENTFGGMLYTGYRPTLFNRGELRIEVNIFDFKGNLYGKNIVVEFIDYLRGDIKFKNEKDLIAQLKKDKKAAIEVLRY